MSAEAPVVPPSIPIDEAPRPAVRMKPPTSMGRRFTKRFSLRKNRSVLTIAIFLVLWHLVAEYVVDRPLFLTGPIDVFREMRELWSDGTLQNDLWVSASEFVKGFTGGLVVGVALGTALGTSRRFKEYIDPVINGMYATPIIALAPLFILWFGIGETKTIVLVFILVVLPIAINTDVGMRATETQHIEAARSFGATRWQLFKLVRLPTSISFVIAGIRMGIARGLIGVVVGEFFGSQAGLGYRILVSSQFFNNAAVLGGVIIFAGSGMALVMAFERIERRVAPWKFKEN